MQHELPFSLAQDLCDFFRHLLQQYGSQAVEETSLSNVKAGQIARECILKSFKTSIFEDLSTTPFALMFDESNDVYGSPYLCTHVRYVKNGKVQNRFLSLEEITESATGESLFELVQTKVFNESTALYLQKNLVGICSDKASNMISSKEKGLLNRFKTIFPWIIIVHDFSHLFNLVIENALTKFPNSVLTLIRSVSKHFSVSALRRAQFKQCQIRMEDAKDAVQVLQMLRYVPGMLTTGPKNSPVFIP